MIINQEHRTAFETFKSNVCHLVKDMGDLGFMIEVLETDAIGSLWKKQWYPESLYLLAMVDYLSNENDIPLCTNYDELRSTKLKEIAYPTGILILSKALQNDWPQKESLKKAIPEFMRFNIVESEVRNVC